MGLEKHLLFLCVSVSILLFVAFFIVDILGNYYTVPFYIEANFFVAWVVLLGWALILLHCINRDTPFS